MYIRGGGWLYHWSSKCNTSSMRPATKGKLSEKLGWVGTESCFGWSWYSLIIIWDYDDNDDEEKSIHFRLYVNFVDVVIVVVVVVVGVVFFGGVYVWLVSCCRLLHSGKHKSWIMEISNDWGHSGFSLALRLPKKYDRWDQTFVHLRFWSSAFKKLGEKREREMAGTINHHTHNV